MNLREIERATIAMFLRGNSDKLTGQVLDVGCGHQPYRDIVEDAGGEYVGYDRTTFGGSVGVTEGDEWEKLGAFDTIVMTQVWQYIEPRKLQSMLLGFAHGGRLTPGGWLLATGPTNWATVEKDDLWRFTPDGVLHLVADAGFVEVEIGVRHSVKVQGESWPVGWAVAARSEQ